MGILYATREQVMRAPEILESTHSGTKIDATIDASSRSVEGFLHRRFYPELRTILKDWPNNSGSPTWEVDLGDQELISVTAVTSGGTDITDDVILRRGDDLDEPPYSKLAIDLTSNSAFSAGTSWQRSLSITGVFGYNDTATALAGGALNDAINSSVTLIQINPLDGYYTAEIGSLILIDTERMILADRRMVTTGETTGGGLTDRQNDKLILCGGATDFAVGEIILIDAERMRIEDTVTGALIVTRAWDGTVLATHSGGTTINALRQFIVQRGALGSTAAAHDDEAPVYVHAYPALLNQLVVAETIVTLQQMSAAYGRTIGSGAGTREAAGIGLDDLRERAWRQLGRKGRSAAI